MPLYNSNFLSRSFYLNTDKEYQENELLKELHLPSNLKVDDLSIFQELQETPLLDPFQIKVKQLPVYNMLTGEKTDEMITLNNRVFGMPLREDVLHRVVVWQVIMLFFISSSLLNVVLVLTV